MSMQWVFFPNGGGQENGFNDAGEETFKGNVEQYVAREVIQNSLDARDDHKKPVKVVFDVVEIQSSDLPDTRTLGATLNWCGEFWKELNPKAFKFFEEAKVLARAKKITALKCSDYNTVGVSGTDDDRKQGWYNLLRSSGSSSKLGGEGGSFGIGKNAPFVASMMRTVLYSTLTKDKKVAFQGVARLVTHERPKMGKAQHVGYLGDKEGGSIRNSDLIPTCFSRKKPGTDVFILGYKAEATFEDDLVRSVLDNFWPAIHFGDLEVDVAGTKVTKASLAKMLIKYSNDGEFTAHLYYRAVVDKKSLSLAKDLPHLGEVSLELLPGEGLPKRVAMVRKTGMVIYLHQFRSPVPFCGVFLCQNDKGNEVLREMEPPRHDTWDANRPEKGANRKIASEFTTYIRDSVKLLAPVDTQTVINIPDLSQYLPDDEDSADEGFEGQTEPELSKKESFQRQPEVKAVATRKLDRSRRQMKLDETDTDDGDLDTELAGEGDGTGGGASGGANGGAGGSGAGGGGKGSSGAEPKKGSEDGLNSKPIIPIRSRIFASNLPEGRYTAVLEPVNKTKVEVLLTVKAVADDATSSMVAIASANQQGGKPLETPRSGVIGPLRFGKGKLVIEFTLSEPRKFAMEVVAHEAE